MAPLIKIRHCAFCLKSIGDREIKLCGKCRKRSYCSRDCQIADWQFPGNGQGHKNWCATQCGEEDLDWEVRSVPGKGLGLIAKRKILAKERIIVEACRPMDHPGINDLMPINGTKQEKYLFNAVGCGEALHSALCLRIARANHNCDPNADQLYDKTFKVVILFADKDIAAGDEICINYHTYNDIGTHFSPIKGRTILSIKWGITCHETCLCYDEERNKLIEKCRRLDREIGRSESLQLVDELLENQEILKLGLHNQIRTLNDGFRIAIEQDKLRLAKPYGAKLFAIQSAIMLPESAELKEISKYMLGISLLCH